MEIGGEGAPTPYYVLLDGSARVGPDVLESSGSVGCFPLYGFSSKRAYDRFCGRSSRALKPYPLVTRYLQSQADAPDVRLKLIVLDAAGPGLPSLGAATMTEVLQAQESRTEQLPVSYRLTLDPEANAYRVSEARR
jgi:hypothetical protein